MDISKMRVLNIGRSAVTLRTTAAGKQMTIKIPEMLRVQAGTFSMGSTRIHDAQPIRQVTLPDFAIGKYAVTNGEYSDYLRVMGYGVPNLRKNPKFALIWDKHDAVFESRPVVRVSWNDIMLQGTGFEKYLPGYCKFLREITKSDENPSGRKFRLPTEAEWEYAARGPEGRTFPWGDEWDESKVVFDASASQPVNTHPEGTSWCGAMNMSGNVNEWVLDWYADSYNAKDLINPKGPENGAYRVLRGGCWKNDDFDRIAQMSAWRGANSSNHDDVFVGFRLVEELG